jgi:UDP-glucose 4-epimerase
MSEQKNILITGGAGFIGSHVAELCLSHGHQVTVLDDLSVGVKQNVPKGAELVVGDILTFDITDLLGRKQITDICHLAAKVSIRNSLETFIDDANVNFMGTLRLIKSALECSLESFVLASSMAVYADCPQKTPVTETFTKAPISPYGVSKLAAEKDLFILLENTPCRPVALRYFNTYGPRQRLTPYVGVITIFADALRKKEPIRIFGDGTQQRDFVSVLDVASATVSAIENQNARGVFNVGAGRSISVIQLADMMLDVFGLPSSYKTFVSKDRTELTYSVADITNTSSALHFQPKHDLRSYLATLVIARDLRDFL